MKDSERIQRLEDDLQNLSKQYLKLCASFQAFRNIVVRALVTDEHGTVQRKKYERLVDRMQSETFEVLRNTADTSPDLASELYMQIEKELEGWRLDNEENQNVDS